MKISALIFSLLIGCVALNAQSLVWSDALKSGRELANITVTGADASGFFVVEENKKDGSIKLMRYSSADMKVQWTQSIPVASGTNQHQFESLLVLEDKFFFFTSGFSKESEQFQIYCAMLDAKGTKISDPALVHYTLAEDTESAPEFGYTISPDKLKILLYFDLASDKKMTDAVSFKLYDNTLELIMEKELMLPYTQDIVQVHNYMLDNNGNIYLMSGRNPDKHSTAFQSPAAGRHVVYFYSHAGNKLKEYDVSLKEKHVVSVVFNFNQAQDVVIAGYYSNEEKLTVAGTFLFVIANNGGAVKAASFMPFTVDFLNKFKRDSKDLHDATLTDYYLDQVITQADGSMLLIGEQHYTSGNEQEGLKFNYDDLIVTRLELNGRQTWNVKIPKRQHVTENPQTCSYRCFQDTDGIRIYFNDNSENQQKLIALAEGEATAWSGLGGTITCVRVTSKGTFKREDLSSLIDQSFQLRPSLSSPTIVGPSILGLEDSKNYKFCAMK